jgi:ATP-dependent helicase/nuclease subunit A
MTNWTKEQTQAIYEKDKNILVSAGAGSGKTAVLTQRVIEKLKSGVHIDELLILTFTNAAAREMKERIRNKIKKEDSLKEELKRIDAAYITTFDSFTFSILKKYHYKKNISSQVKIMDSSIMDLMKKKILNEIFEEYYTKKDENFLNLIRTFAVKDDEKIKENLLILYKKIEQRIDKLSFLEKGSQNSLLEENFLEKQYLFFIADKKEKIKTLLNQLSFEAEGDFLEKMHNAIDPIFSSTSVFPERLPSLPSNSSSKLKKIKEELKKEIDSLKEWMELDTCEHIQNYQKTIPFIQMICEILLKLDKKIQDYKQKEDVYEFIDIELLATTLLEENQEIKEELKHKFKEIMIDEYQDTNDLQEYFISLIQNNNVYMVGDIKQSIYRFRNANPNIFKEKYNTYKNNKNGIKIDMNQNFRSREEVVEDINHLFSALMDEELGGIHYKLDHQMIFGNQTYIKNHPNQNYHIEILSYDEKANEKTEAMLIASDIQKKVKSGMLILDKETSILRPITYKDFAILLDRTTYAEEYKKIFEKYQIPLDIIKEESILENDLISVIKNIIHYIFLHREKKDIRYYFTSIARSFLFEYSDEEIFDILNNQQIENTEINKKIKQIEEKIPFMTSNKLIEEIIDTFEIEEKMIKIGNIKENEKIIDTIYHIALETSQLGYTPYEFHKFLEELFENKLDMKLNTQLQSENGVQLMTIHKSKGLEFPICYFAGLKKKFNISDLNDTFLYNRDYGIITPFYEEGIKDTFLKEIIKEQYIEEEIGEKIRLFYVALTRAKEQMIFVTPTLDEEQVIEDKIKYRSFYDLLNANKPILEPFIKQVKVEEIKENTSKEEENNFFKIEVEENEITLPVLEEETFSKHSYVLHDDKIKQNMKFGNTLHALFENIDFDNLENISEKDKQYIEPFLKLDIFKNRNEGTIYKEYEFIYYEDNKKYHGIIDLMIVYPNYIDIIDYKTNDIHDPAYIKQVNGYKKYIGIKSQKPVNIYLYSILKGTLKKL